MLPGPFDLLLEFLGGHALVPPLLCSPSALAMIAQASRPPAGLRTTTPEAGGFNANAQGKEPGADATGLASLDSHLRETCTIADEGVIIGTT
jgi:hypothetical protein